MNIPFNFDLPFIVVALLSSAIGYLYFRHGRRNAQAWYVICGIGLMIDSYIFTTLLSAILSSLVLAVIPLLANRLFPN